jgi:hypothetical protein
MRPTIANTIRVAGAVLILAGIIGPLVWRHRVLRTQIETYLRIERMDRLIMQYWEEHNASPAEQDPVRLAAVLQPYSYVWLPYSSGSRRERKYLPVEWRDAWGEPLQVRFIAEPSPWPGDRPTITTIIASGGADGTLSPMTRTILSSSRPSQWQGHTITPGRESLDTDEWYRTDFIHIGWTPICLPYIDSQTIEEDHKIPAKVWAIGLSVAALGAALLVTVNFRALRA